MPTRHRHLNLWAVTLSAALLSVACDDGKDLNGPAPTATGLVTASAATHSCTAAVEVLEFGDFALYAPACVTATRGLILALGGPDTRGFVTGKPLGAPFPAVEASLQMLGQELRTLASTSGLAILGRRGAMKNEPASDQILFDAVQTGAVASGHPELPTVPVLMYGISGGAPQASGFIARNPERVAGLFLKVPAGVSSLSGDALRVPTFMVQAELDAFVNNVAITAAFEGNRSAGALWGRAMERGVAHHSLSALQRQVTINWMSTILSRRLPGRPSDPLREIDETSGWLGDLGTGETKRWAAYKGDRAAASWLPSNHTAKEWEIFVSAAPIP